MTESPPPDSAGTETVITIGGLAHTLHKAGTQELEVEIPAGVPLQLTGVPGASVEDGKLRFASLECRNRAVVAAVLADLGGRGTDPEALSGAAKQLWRDEIGHPDMASGRLLAAAHPQVDLLRFAAARITDASSAFDALHLVEAALPYLEAIDWPALIALCDAEQPLTQRDLASGLFYGHITRWLTQRPAAARDLLELLLAAPSLGRGNLIGAAWMAWFSGDPQAAIERLLEAAAHSPPALPDITCWIAGRMLAEPAVPADLAPQLENLVLARIASADASERRAGLAAAAALLHLRRGFDAALRARIESGETEAAAYVMQTLAREDAPLLQAGLFFDWLQLCVGLDQGFEGVLRELDHTLSTLMRPPHIDAVLAFLESWIQAHLAAPASKREFAERFGSCARKMLSNPALLGRVLTQWMLSDGRALASAAAGVIQTAGSHRRSEIGFDPTLLDEACEADLRFLAKRILGFVIEADHMLSLALSLLRVRNAKDRVHPMMHWLLCDEIGYDYPGTTIRRLRAQAEQEQDTDARNLLMGIAARLEADMSALEALPRLRELSVPQALRRDFQKARAKQMERSMREGQKQSVFLQLVSQVHVKAGDSSFQYLENEFSQPTHFASHSVSFELPRREVLDPVGNTYRLLQLRVAKRETT